VPRDSGYGGAGDSRSRFGYKRDGAAIYSDDGVDVIEGLWKSVKWRE
jgi:hypothetical protein